MRLESHAKYIDRKVQVAIASSSKMFVPYYEKRDADIYLVDTKLYLVPN